jgi:hypothetical protein
MRIMDELVAETLRLLNALEPRIESLRLTNSRGESTVRREVSEKSYIKKEFVNNGHDRARRQQYNLLPYCPAFMLADRVNLIQYNPSASYDQHKLRVRAEKLYRLIRGVHVLAKGGERSIIPNISATVTRI